MFPWGPHFVFDSGQYQQIEQENADQIAREPANIRGEINANFAAPAHPPYAPQFPRPNMELPPSFPPNHNSPTSSSSDDHSASPASFPPPSNPPLLPNNPPTIHPPHPFPPLPNPPLLPTGSSTTDFYRHRLPPPSPPLPPPPPPNFQPLPSNGLPNISFPSYPSPFLTGSPTITFPPVPVCLLLSTDPPTVVFPPIPVSPFFTGSPPVIRLPPIHVPPIPCITEIHLDITVDSPPSINNPRNIPLSSVDETNYQLQLVIDNQNVPRSARSNSSSHHRIAIDSVEHQTSTENTSSLSRDLPSTSATFVEHEQEKEKRNHRFSRCNRRNLKTDDDTSKSIEKKQDIVDENVKNNNESVVNEFECILNALDLPNDDEIGTNPTEYVVVTRVIERIRQLKIKIAFSNGKIRRSKRNIKQLNDKIESLQASLPSSSRTTASTASQKAEMEQFLERYTKERTRQDYRFWIMAKMMQEMMKTLIERLSQLPSNRVLAEMSEWLQANFQPSVVRPNASSLLVYLATHAGMLNDPNALQEYIQKELSQQ
ncbi:Protein WBSCR14 [Dirofilaria immitis]